LVVPFFGDQPFWGAMVARAGAGPDPIPHKQLTADKLADAINFCLRPGSLDRAEQLAAKIAAEQGSDVGAQSFHQYLEVDRLRCTLAPSRVAVWRVKRTQVRLSAFAACTLAKADLLDFHDLKLFRAQEHYTDEGPIDPVSGGFTAVCRAFGNMGIGIAELPSETYKAFVPSGPRRRQSQVSVRTTAGKVKTVREGNPTLPTSPEQSATTQGERGSLARVQSLPAHPSGPSFSISNIGSSSGRKEPGSGKSNDMMRQTGAHSSKGAGRFAKALVQSPMELSVSFTKGFHNIPKLYGDDTVRPQQRVSDLKSGFKAVGKEFGYGWYDGITGIFTQPWNGAQKDGASGFAKGIGKGIGGLLTKPGAALLGILGYSMKGVHKEIQKSFGNNVQSYIVTSRVAQGYEDWLESPDAEKQDIIVRWKLIQKYLKKKRSPDEMVRDILEEQRKMNMEGIDAHPNRTYTTSSSASVGGPPAQNPGSGMPAMHDSQFSLHPADMAPEDLLGATEVDETIQRLVQETSRGNPEDDASVEQSIRDSVYQLQRQHQEAGDHQADHEAMLQAVAASEAEAQRQVNEALKYEEELKKVMAQSLKEQRSIASASNWESEQSLDDSQGGKVEPTGQQWEMMARKAGVAASASSGAQPPLYYDPGHVAGTTQSAFEAQQWSQQGEKTAQEKTEEEIVMEYVKKQSLLEAHHHNKGKGRATTTKDEDQ
jgi:hypothetical protein